MIKVTVKKAARSRGIQNSYQLAQRLGRTAGKPDDGLKVLAGRLWNGTFSPKLETIDRVAEALGDCDLSELLTRKPNGRKKTEPLRRPKVNGLSRRA